MVTSSSTDPAEQARINMVECQLRPNRIYNPGVLQAMIMLPRENYVPDSLKSVAYTDNALKIGPDRYILEPMVIARLFETALIAPHEHVLIVGSGTGYAAAIAGHVAASVVALEQDETLVKAAGSLPGNVVVETGLLASGCATRGPYDVIVVDGAVASAPRTLFGQMKPHGRLVTVLREPGAAAHIVIYESVAGQVSHRVAFDNVAAILPGFEPRPEFALA